MSSNNISNTNEQSVMEPVASVQVDSKSDLTELVKTDESKPIQNVWKKRFENAIKSEKPASEESSFLNVTSESDTITGKGSGKGYSKNYGKGYGKGKGYIKNTYNEDKEYTKNDGKGKGKGKGKGYRQYEMKELTPEEKLYREEKTKAFNLAQDTAIKMCVDRCTSKVREDVNSSISYEMNYRRILVMDITEDDIVVDVDGNKHVYSLRRFLENRYFQNNVREEYAKLLPEAWIRLFAGRDEGTFCIGIQKKKD